MHERPPRLTRRQLQRLAILAPAPLAAALLSGRTAGLALDPATPPAGDEPLLLAPTPPCGDDDDLVLTVPQTAGPFYTPNSPERHSLIEPDTEGRPLVVAGYVYTTDCQPIPSALLDFWQADDGGAYDNIGFRLRGHQFSDEDGRFELTTIMPGLYPGRTRHIHVIVQAPFGQPLTTQLYFPDEPANERDRIFDDRLVVDLQDDTVDDTLVAFFTFVLPTD